MPEQYRNHAEEIAAALRENAAGVCDSHAATLVGAPAKTPTPRPNPAPDLHFAKSVLTMHLDRLYRGRRDDRGLGAEQTEEVRSAVDAIVTEAVTRYTAELTEDDMERLSMRLNYSELAGLVNWVGVAQYVDAKTVAQHIDIAYLAATLAPMVLPELARQVRESVASERAAASTAACAQDGGRVPKTMRWIKHADIVGMVSISHCEFCGEHHPRRAVYSDGDRYYAFCPQNGGRQMDLQDYEPVLSKPEAERPAQQYRGPDTNGCGHHDERPALAATAPERPAMIWEQLAGDGRMARILNCSACGHDHARVQGVKHDNGHWYFACPVCIIHVTLPDFPEIPW
jgi:hypothetical protein